MDIDGLWETYHTVKKISELGSDESGNRFNQSTYGMALMPGGECDLDEYLVQSAAPMQEHLCNTAMCFAGWYLASKHVPMNRAGLCTYNGLSKTVSNVAQKIGGFNRFTETRDLFSANNSLADIGEILVIITGEDHR